MRVRQQVSYARNAGDREVASHQHVPVELLGLVERLRVVGKAPGSPGHLWTAVNHTLLRWLRARPYVEPGRVRFFSRLMRGPKAGPRGTRQSSKSREEAHPAPLGQRRRPSATVRGDRPRTSLFQSYYRTCLDNTDRATPLSRCATQGPDLRTSSWSATLGTTNLADLPGYARSPVSRPATEGPVPVHERRKRQSNDLQTSTRTWSCHR